MNLALRSTDLDRTCGLAPLLACFALMLGCGRSNETPQQVITSDGKSLTKVTAQLNWHPEAEHGGLYQAAADKTFENAGFEVEIVPGGVGTPIASELVLGRSQFAITNADDVVLFREQGADVVAVLSSMQNHPRCIIARSDSGVKTFKDLAGKTFQCGGGRPYLTFLENLGLLKDVTQVPYHNSIASLVGDPNVVIQGYSFAEPLLARQQGVEVNLLMVSDLGWNPYASVLVTTGDLIREKPEMVRQFVAATRAGWQNYMTDPSLGNEMILAANKEGMTAEALEFGSKELRSLALPEGHSLESVGTMSAERWETLVRQMVDMKLVSEANVKAFECFTTQFIE
jgi:NitT/TauT family transport system substrate-binding protein